MPMKRRLTVAAIVIGVAVCISVAAACSSPSCQACIDATSDASSDSPDASDSLDSPIDSPCFVSPTMACDQSCSGDTSKCCFTYNTCVADVDGCSGFPVWDCQLPSDCPAGQVCCVISYVEAQACPPLDIVTVGGASCSPGCAAGTSQLCLTDSDCDGGKCRPAQIISDPTFVGLCM